MSRRLRWALAACATLAVVTAIFLWRLDTDELRLRIAERIADTLQQPVHIGGVRLSLMHGLSLDLDTFEIQARGEHRLSLRADKASIQLDLIDLLRGDIDVTGVFLLAPRISLPPQALRQKHIPEGLELEQVKIQNGEIWREDGEKIANDVFLDARDIMPGGDMRWELSADIRGGNVRAFGQTSLRGRSFASAFGKLEIDGVPMASLPFYALPAWLNERQVDCHLTFNLNRAGNWKLDGDIDINLPDHARADIHLRGEMTGSTATGLFAWRDSFVHIGGTNVLAARGEQLADGGLSANMQGKQLKMDELLALADIKLPLRGLGDIDANMRLDGNAWAAEGHLGLSQLQWAETSLPDLDVRIHGLDWQGSQLSLSQAQMSHPGKSGLLLLKSLHWTTDSLGLQAQLQAVEDWWVPLSNTALEAQGAAGVVEGAGLLTGKISLHRGTRESTLDMTVDATTASLSYQGLQKTRGFEASGSLSMQNNNGQKNWRLHDIRLGNSRLAQGDWQSDARQQRLHLQGMQLDATELGSIGIWETLKARKWRGKINGELQARRAGEAMGLDVDDLPSWLDSTEADVNMARFGLDDAWSGDLALQSGQAQANQLTWHSNGQSVQFSGDLDLLQRSGRLNINQASIELEKLPEISAWLAGAELEGRLAAMKLSSGRIELRNAGASYRLYDGKLRLKKLRADLGGGKLRADSLSLNLAAPAWPLSLPRLHLHRVQLDQLEIGQRVSAGRLFATLGLSGSLRGGQWRANGDMEIYSGKLSGMNLAARIGELTGEAYGSHEVSTPFSKFQARFRLAENILKLQHVNLASTAFKLEGAGHVDMATQTPEMLLDATLLLPLQGGLKPGKSYVEHDGSIHVPLLVSGHLPEIVFDLNEPKLDQIHAMKASPKKDP